MFPRRFPLLLFGAGVILTPVSFVIGVVAYAMPLSYGRDQQVTTFQNGRMVSSWHEHPRDSMIIHIFIRRVALIGFVAGVVIVGGLLLTARYFSDWCERFSPEEMDALDQVVLALLVAGAISYIAVFLVRAYCATHEAQLMDL